MEKKRGRGRPRITEKRFGDMAEMYENRLTAGKSYRSRRSTADTVYAYEAMRILMDAASEIEDLQLLFDEKTRYMCRSIISQLGRMYQVNGYDEESVVYVAKAAIPWR